MKTCIEGKKQSKLGRNRKQNIFYLNKAPTFVVAFAVKETYDQAMISTSPIVDCRSSSFHSTSADSSNIESDSKSKNTLTAIDSNASNNETKIDMEENVEMVEESLKTTVYDDETIEDDSKQPQVLFNSKNTNKRKENVKKPKNYNQTVKIRNIHFKNKGSKITKKIQKHYTKKHATCAQIKNDLYSDCITEVVSRDRVVKTALAKENLLEVANQEPFAEDGELMNENDSTTSASSLANSYTTAKSFTSGSTLVNKDSESSKSDNSVIEVKQDPPQLYKADVTAMAVTKLSCKPNMVGLMNGKFATESLTSNESISPIDLKVSLTSEPPSEVTATGPISDMSDSTLMPNESISNISSTRFVIARTSSDFRESTSDSSYCMLTNNSEKLAHIDNQKSALLNNRKQDVFENIDSDILRMGPGVIASTSKPSSLSNETRTITGIPSESSNDVIVTKEKLTNLPFDMMKEQPYLKTNVFQKSFNGDGEAPLNSLILPNGSVIKNMINEKPKFPCSHEYKHPNNEYKHNTNSNNSTEMWDKIVVVLDVVVKRLEESLADKILREIKTLTRTQYNSSSIETPIPEMNKKMFDLDFQEAKVDVAEKEVLVTGEKKDEEDKSFQCSLVDNKVIDSLMLKLSKDGPKYVLPIKSGPVEDVVKEPNLRKDYVKVLKPPEKSILIEDTAIEDTLTSTSLAAAASEKIAKTTLGSVFAVPAAFLRENMFVIATIPTFFVFIFLLYTASMLIIKVW